MISREHLLDIIDKGINKASLYLLDTRYEDYTKHAAAAGCLTSAAGYAIDSPAAIIGGGTVAAGAYAVDGRLETIHEEGLEEAQKVYTDRYKWGIFKREDNQEEEGLEEVRSELEE